MFSSLAGAVDPALILEQIEAHISIVKDEAFSRRDILERVEKWLAACDEESWLEEYSRVGLFVIQLVIYISLPCNYLSSVCIRYIFQDENRYSAGRGAHLTLKRAEKARAIVNKIPGFSCPHKNSP